MSSQTHLAWLGLDASQHHSSLMPGSLLGTGGSAGIYIVSDYIVPCPESLQLLKHSDEAIKKPGGGTDWHREGVDAFSGNGRFSGNFCSFYGSFCSSSWQLSTVMVLGGVSFTIQIASWWWQRLYEVTLPAIFRFNQFWPAHLKSSSGLQAWGPQG
jgi:hypothetical protein